MSKLGCDLSSGSRWQLELQLSDLPSKQQDRRKGEGPASSFLLFIYLFIYLFWLHWVFVAAHGLSLVAASGGLLFVAVRRLLIAVASLVAEHEF